MKGEHLFAHQDVPPVWPRATAAALPLSLFIVHLDSGTVATLEPINLKLS